MAFRVPYRNSLWISLILSTFTLLHLIKGISGLQRFDKQPSYSEVNPGDDIKLDCKIFNKRGTCSWQKDNKPVGIYIKKYEWSGSQEAGDCSLWIRAATLEFDDGEWECQVTASDFTTQDALTSTPVRLVVRVAPQRPRIEHKSVQVLPANNVTARAGDKTTVKCISRYGNPPAKLKWFLGETELLGGNQSNSPEMDNPRTWVATSVIDINVEKVQHGKTLRCVAIHESYPTKAQSLDVRLDVTYPPEVRMIGEPTTDLEENRDSVDIRCVTDANPPAAVVWKKLGLENFASVEESLQFRPITRRDSGVYTCRAQNSLGTSEPLSVTLDVKFGPIIKSVGPNRETTTTLYSEASFDCEAEASPTPSYQWLQRVPGMDNAVLVRSNDARLHIRNVSYHHQGDYICRVWNYIGGSERSIQSDPVSLKVKGPPQMIRGTGVSEVIALRGTEALLTLVVCSDPGPAKASWEWGSLHLQVGESLGRFKADQLSQQENRDICYEARLHIFDVDAADSRNYFLNVENERGTDRHYLRLAVRGSYTNEPLAMMTLVSLAGGCLTFFFVCVLCGVYCARTEKCCFSRRSDFQPTDLESEKSDISSMMSRKGGGPIVTGIGSGPRGPADLMSGCGIGSGGVGGHLRSSTEPIYRSSGGGGGGGGGGLLVTGGPHSINAPSPDAMKKKKKRRQRKDGGGKSSDESVRMCHDDVPTVSNHHGGGSGGGGSSGGVGGVGGYPTPHQRLAYYATKSFPSPPPTAADYGPSPYFCPAPQQNRSFTYDNARTMRASSYYQPNSIDKAEI